MILMITNVKLEARIVHATYIRAVLYENEVNTSAKGVNKGPPGVDGQGPK